MPSPFRQRSPTHLSLPPRALPHHSLVLSSAHTTCCSHAARVLAGRTCFAAPMQPGFLPGFTLPAAVVQPGFSVLMQPWWVAGLTQVAAFYYVQPKKGGPLPLLCEPGRPSGGGGLQGRRRGPRLRNGPRRTVPRIRGVRAVPEGPRAAREARPAGGNARDRCAPPFALQIVCVGGCLALGGWKGCTTLHLDYFAPQSWGQPLPGVPQMSGAMSHLVLAGKTDLSASVTPQ